jgi:hypothetical protein
MNSSISRRGFLSGILPCLSIKQINEEKGNEIQYKRVLFNTLVIVHDIELLRKKNSFIFNNADIIKFQGGRVVEVLAHNNLYHFVFKDQLLAMGRKCDSVLVEDKEGNLFDLKLQFKYVPFLQDYKKYLCLLK